jgi:hypothetical protein
VELSPAAAEHLAAHQGVLGLGGIRSLEEASIQWLSKHQRQVLLPARREISGKTLPRPVGDGMGYVSRMNPCFDESECGDFSSAA